MRTAKTLRQQHGFTLIELMMVVAVIGLLASMAIPRYQDYINRARVAEAFTLSAPVREAVADYYIHRGRFPEDNREAALIDAEDIRGHNVAAMAVEEGAIHVRIELGEEQKTLSLRPSIPVAYPPVELLSWVCGHAPSLEGMQTYGEDRTDLDDQMLPPVCRSDFGAE